MTSNLVAIRTMITAILGLMTLVSQSDAVKPKDHVPLNIRSQEASKSISPPITNYRDTLQGTKRARAMPRRVSISVQNTVIGGRGSGGGGGGGGKDSGGGPAGTGGEASGGITINLGDLAKDQETTNEKGTKKPWNPVKRIVGGLSVWNLLKG